MTHARGAIDRRDLFVSAILAGALMVLYCATRQETVLLDGQNLARKLGEGHWRYHHIAYLPVAQVLHAFLSPLSAAGSDQTLLILSAGTTSLAAAILYLGLRSFVSREVGILGAVLMATCPVVWFYATCIEVHALQLLAATIAVAWLLYSRASADSDRGSLLPAMLLCLLAATHMTGLLWGPALATYWWLRGDPRRRPRDIVLGLLTLVLFFGAWRILNRDRPFGQGISVYALEGLRGAWSPGLAVRELVVPAGVLFPLGLLGAVWVLRRRSLRRDPLVVSSLVLAGTFLPFAFTLSIDARGAYFISLAPVAAAATCALVRDLRKPVLVVLGVLLVLANVTLSTFRSWEWNHRYRGWDWVPSLVREAEEDALVLVLERWEMLAIRRHSSLEVIEIPEFLEVAPQLAPEEIARLLKTEPLDSIDLILTRNLYETDRVDLRPLVDALVGLAGTPGPGRHPGFLVIR